MASKVKYPTKFQQRQQERREQIEQRRMIMSKESVTRNLAKIDQASSGSVNISKMFDFSRKDVSDAGKITPLKTSRINSITQRVVKTTKKPSDTTTNTKDNFNTYSYFGRSGITPPNNGEAYPGEFSGTPLPKMSDVSKTNTSNQKDKIANHRFAAGDSKNNNRAPLKNQVKPNPVVQKKPLLANSKLQRASDMTKKTPLPPPIAMRSMAKSLNKQTAKPSSKIVSKPLNKSAPNISKSPRKLPAKIPKNMAPCKSCNRLFNVFRVERHEAICEKTEALRKTRKPYDGSKHRLKGTIVEEFLRAKDGGGDESATTGIAGSPDTANDNALNINVNTPTQATQNSTARLSAGENRSSSTPSTTIPKALPKKPSDQWSSSSRKSSSHKKTYEQFIKDMRVQYRDALAPPEPEPIET